MREFRTFTLVEIAEIVEGSAAGDLDVRVRDIRPVDEADSESLAFLASKRYVGHAESSRAAAFLVAKELSGFLPEGSPHVSVDDPHAALQLLLSHMHPEPGIPAGIHPTAVLGRGVVIGDDVGIGPYSVLGDRAEIGAGTRIGAQVVIGADCRVGRDAVFHPHSTLYDSTIVGDRVTVHSGARLGSDGFGYALVEGEYRKIPQLGGCIVGDDVEIGANACVDRGSIGDTELGSKVKLDNLVQVAHNVKVGSGTLVASLSGVAGSTRIGERVWIGGQVGVINHLSLGDDAQVAFGSILYKDLPAGETVSGHPARSHRQELRTRAQTRRLPGLVERVKELEQTVAELRGRLEES
jgi:UDP-3-O-[3-hydroxymyristoyl] glucosamine N-acyltransferase